MATMKCDMAGAAAMVAATFAIAELGLPVRVTTVVPMAENMRLRRLDPARRRAHDVRRRAPSRCSTPTPRAGWCSADALVLAARGPTRPDRRRGHPDRRLRDRARRPGRRHLRQRRGAGRRRPSARGARAGELLWPLPIAEEMTDKVRTYSKIADLMQHNIDVVRRRALRRGVPAGVRRRRTVGAPRHRRPRRSTTAVRTATSPAAAPAPPSPPWSSWPPSCRPTDCSDIGCWE